MLDGPYVNAIPITQGIDVLLPSGTQIRSSHTAQLIFSGLPLSATQCYVFPDLITGSLLSIGLLCNHGCVAKFDATTVAIFHYNNIIITGFCCPHTKLWTINLGNSTPTTTPVPTPVLEQHTTLAVAAIVAEQVAFMNATLCSPAISTWCNAIDKGYFPTWHMLTATQVLRHAPFSPPMIKGHMDQTRSNQQSTKSARSNHVFAAVHEITGKIATDQTGFILLASSNGNNHLLIA